jgi:hypothetical protein
METLTFKQKGNNYVPEAKPNEELENIAYITDMSIQQLMDADVNKKRRILNLLIFLEHYP